MLRKIWESPNLTQQIREQPPKKDETLIRQNNDQRFDYAASLRKQSCARNL